MSDPRAFVSFDFDHDESSRNLFVGQAKSDSPTPFTVQDWSSRTELPESEWEEEMAKRNSATNMCIVLAGKHMSSAIGVAAEIAMAKDKNVPVFGVYVDGADSQTILPSGLARNRTVAWKWDSIAAMVDLAMTEGKNG